MLEEQARFEARSEAHHARLAADFARSSRRLDRIESVLTQTNRVVGKLASMGVGLRSDVRRHERAMARHEEMMAEMEGKLNALIDIADQHDGKIGALFTAMEKTDSKLNALIVVVDKMARRNGR